MHRLATSALLALAASPRVCFGQNGTSTYDPAQALQLLYVAASAYCAEADVEQWDCVPCKLGPALQPGSVVWLNNASTEATGLVGKAASADAAYVSYRGSDNIANWIEDADFAQVPWPLCAGCAVHQGFYLDYLGTADALLAQLDALNASSVYVTGHSLGAAIGQLAAWEISAAGLHLAGMVNFGQPRTGSPLYAAGFNAQVVAGADGSGFNIAALAAGAPVSPLFARAMRRAMAHAANARAVDALGGRRGADRVLAALEAHAAASVAHARSAVRTPPRAMPPLPPPISADEAAALQLLRAPAPSVGAPAFRLVHYHDVVPQLPPQRFFDLNFSHAVQEVWYDEEAGPGYRACSTATGEDPTCSDSNIDLSGADHSVYLGISFDSLC